MTSIVFDMDDTLYKERTYRDSGYRTVARHFAASCGKTAEELYAIMTADPATAFETVSELAAARGIEVNVQQQLNVYRSHLPDIVIDNQARQLLEALVSRGTPIGLITDGRAWGQLNKISALGLERYFDPELIMATVLDGTDKHSPEPFDRMERLLRKRGADRLVYVGDNPSKDFLHPNLRGWRTVMLRDGAGLNIHPQRLSEWPPENRPQTVVESLEEVLKL